MTVLVTGGAGYIGMHTVAELVAHGEPVVVVDDLSTGHWPAGLFDVPFYSLDIQDGEAVGTVMARHGVDAVVHFAAKSLVGESVRDPLLYYERNVAATAQLLRAMVRQGVRRMVFSSTAAVYGHPGRVPIQEDDPKQPVNPYGETKLAIERMLRWGGDAYGISAISLRYFNAAGAHPELPIGEDHRPETHLIPILMQVALGQREAVTIFGSDYDTPDGTCVRDYIHVMDLASAHRLALERLRRVDAGVEVYNLGTGSGHSVLEVVRVARSVTGHPIPVAFGPRRAGDPAVLVASPARAQAVLGWRPRYTGMEDMVSTAWRWHKSHPEGFGTAGGP
ncbi:UDP-glucose 4-epimerase GalE [Alicyclobacillus macrosporangiidus]|uniref:UDP-glucose 4-epimerase n=1 Tax=Alicyclobacillus macrosporangiidus TaxID=392015 RepID=A0A1I7GTJ6_9BACL|nr:UDP-glucose 4-epimerase GalE [Alicyclobacillus macrosporangiidus]SFU51778.1 UDP-glucose 4-epimerase [Alicyclobacillus macrosporangiidus]